MSAITTDLPSRVEESLAACPRFRILVVGNTGVGKSSLISNVFNISLIDIDIAHDRAGRANISFPYTSDGNPRFILHDSKGFEPGTASNWDVVESFLRGRSATAELKDRVHAIWLCIETPRTGSRLQQTGDEKLLDLAKELQIPCIVVFTKFDMLVNQHLRNARKANLGANVPETEIRKTSLRNAEEDFNSRIKEFQAAHPACIPISTKLAYLVKLQKLTEITRRSLHDVEGDLWLPWAAAQQISARQKVDQCIREGCKKYWINIGHNSAFQGRMLIECVWRIYEDILKVWNFDDPEKLLSNGNLFSKVIILVEDFATNPEAESDQNDWLSKYKDSDVMSLAKDVGTAFAQVLAGVGVGLLALKYLYRGYRAVSSTAQYLGVFIVDLTLVLHRLFLTTLPMEPPRRLSKELIDDAVKAYQDTESAAIHHRVRDLNPVNFEHRIGHVIRESLRMDEDDVDS